MYRDALRGWEELGLPWDRALAVIDMVSVLGPGEPEVAAVAAQARQVLEGLGARPFIERLDAGLAASRDPSSRATARSERERASV